MGRKTDNVLILCYVFMSIFSIGLAFQYADDNSIGVELTKPNDTLINDTLINESRFPDIGFFYKDCEVFADDIVSFSECVGDRVKLVYKYVESPDNPEFGFKEYDYLIENGGDCYDWALFYEMIFKLTSDVTGAYYEVVLINTDIGYENGLQIQYGHAFTVVSTEDGYCVLDQTEIKCEVFSE
jgi:hypothetical protein